MFTARICEFWGRSSCCGPSMDDLRAAPRLGPSPHLASGPTSAGMRLQRRFRRGLRSEGEIEGKQEKKTPKRKRHNAWSGEAIPLPLIGNCPGLLLVISLSTSPGLAAVQSNAWQSPAPFILSVQRATGASNFTNQSATHQSSSDRLLSAM